MTVSTPLNKAVWIGDGVTKSWPVSFRFDKPDHLRLVLTVDGKDVPVAADQWQATVNPSGVGGTVVYPKSGTALAKGRVLTILRVVPLVQDTDLTNQQGLYLDEIERVDDRTVMMVQDMRERLERTLTASVSTPKDIDLTLPSPKAGAGIGWSADGKALVNDPVDFAGTVAAAKGYASAAKASQVAAATSESAAKNFENSASDAAEEAHKWAENPAGIPIVDQEFSARHWAKKASELADPSLAYGVENGQLGPYLDSKVAPNYDDPMFLKNGAWAMQGTGAINGPPGIGAGVLVSRAISGIVHQTVYPYSITTVLAVIWTRVYSGGIFSGWFKVASANTVLSVDHALEVGLLGSSVPRFDNANLNDRFFKSGRFFIGSNSTNTPVISGGFLESSCSGSYTRQIFTETSAAAPHKYLRTEYGSDRWSPWWELTRTVRMTTAAASNCFMDASNAILISSSSIRYKKDVEDMDENYAISFLNGARPVWYRSKSEADNPKWGFWGFVAEDLKNLDARLVHCIKHPDDYHEGFEDVEVKNEDGTIEIKRESQGPVPNEDARSVPDGVQYDRITVLLTKIVQMQDAKIKGLESRLNKLEAHHA